jgi:hypothetical protein
LPSPNIPTAKKHEHKYQKTLLSSFLLIIKLKCNALCQRGHEKSPYRLPTTQAAYAFIFTNTPAGTTSRFNTSAVRAFAS